jgi:hypothetical protein
VRGNKLGAMKDHRNLNLRIPGVVQVCRKVTAAKAPAYEIYVPVPRDPEGKKTGRILMLNSVVRLKELCYTVGDLNMFLPAAEVPDEDIVKTWQDDVTARLVDFDEAVQRLSDYAASREDHEPDVDVFGPASKRAQAAKAAERSQEAKQKEEQAKNLEARKTRVRSMRQESAFDMAHEVLEHVASEEKTSVSVSALSGAAQAAAHPNVKHLTDTLVRMGYLEDLQKGVFLLSDPLGTEQMGRRNRIAKHIKSKADAKEAMLVLCRKGKMDLVVEGLFRIPHFEGEEEPAGQARVSSGSSDHQPLKKKLKSAQDKPQVRKSVSSESAKAANLYDAKNPKLRTLLAGLPATRVAIRKHEYTKPPG